MALLAAPNPGRLYILFVDLRHETVVTPQHVVPRTGIHSESMVAYSETAIELIISKRESLGQLPTLQHNIRYITEPSTSLSRPILLAPSGRPDRRNLASADLRGIGYIRL